MADVIATLGIEVDNAKALVSLDQLKVSTQATAATAERAAATIESANERASSSTQAQAEAARAAQSQVQEATRATAQTRQAAEREASVQRAAQRAEEKRAAAEKLVEDNAAKDALLAQMVAEDRKVISGKALSAQWQAEAAAAKAAAIGTEAATVATEAASVATKGLTLSAETLSVALTGGLILGFQALSGAYNHFTKDARELREEADKAYESLKKLNDEARRGAGDQIQLGINRALEHRAELMDRIARASAARQNRIGGASGASGGVDAGPTPDEIAEIKKATDEINNVLLQGAQERERIRQQEVRDRTESLATLVSAHKATESETREAANKLKQLQETLSSYTQFGGDPADRIRLIEDIKKLNDALNPSTAKADAAAKREQAKAQREYAAELHNSLLAEREVLRFTILRNNERNKEFAQVGVDAVSKLDDEIKRRADIAKQQADRFVAFQKENDALDFQVSLIGKSKVEQGRLADAENARIAGLKTSNAVQIAHYVEQQRLLRENANTTVKWADSLQTVVGIVQLIATGFGDAGRELVQAANGAQSLLAGAEALKDVLAAGKGRGVDGANLGIGGSAGVGGIGAIAGGAFAIVGALNSLDRSQQRYQERATELTAAYDKQYEAANKLIGATNDTTAAISSSTQSLQQQANEALKAQLNAANRKGFNREATDAAFQAYADALENITSLERERTAALEVQAKALAAFAGNNEVLKLRLAGNNSAADAAQVQIDIQTKVDDATKRFGDTIEVAEYRLLLLAQAAKDAADAEARKAETERRSIFDLTNGTAAFGDPRGASQAAFDEAQSRRLSDAMDREASAAELAAIALYNVAEAADRAKQILENDTRTTESLIARILRASGDTRGAEDAVLGASQRQAIVDALREGMSPSNLALLRFTQLAERSQLQMQRAIEDGTKAIQEQAAKQIKKIDDQIAVERLLAEVQIKAIDEQIKKTRDEAQVTAKRFDEQIEAVRESTRAQLEAIDVQAEAARSALEAANRQVGLLSEMVQTNQRVVDALTSFSNSQLLGDLSSLSPAQKAEEARRQFEALAGSAFGGSADAATQLPAAANALLQASRAFNASGSGFVSDEQRIRDVVAGVTAQFGASLPLEQQALIAAQQTVTALQESLQQLSDQKDVITKASDAQIAVLQAAKDKAAEDAQRIVDKLGLDRDEIERTTRETIAKLEETRAAIETAAQAQIEQLIRVETEAHLLRLRQDDYWQTFLGLTGGSQIDGGGSGIPISPDTPVSTVPQDQLTEQRRTNASIEALVESQKEEITTLKQQIALLSAASLSNDQLLRDIATKLDEGNTETRRASEGAFV